MTTRYRGSPYHKLVATRWGPPKLPSHKTACPTEISEAGVDAVFPAAIDAAIVAGDVSAARDGDWPRYVWGRSRFDSADGGQVEVVWEARAENRGVPEYKAYPVSADRHSDHMPWRHSDHMPWHVKAKLWPPS